MKTVEERIAKLEKELAELKAEIKQEETEDDMPCAGDIYHMITSKGMIAIYEWSDCAFDKHCYEIGNCFMSIEDTEFALEKLKVIHELKQFAEPKKKAWDSEDAHFYIEWDFTLRRINIDREYTRKRNCIYFDSVYMAEDAIKAVGEDRIKKYYLEVE